MRGRGDSARREKAAAERTLRQDELRATSPAAPDDDIFGDLYLDFEDTPPPAPKGRPEPQGRPREQPGASPTSASGESPRNTSAGRDGEATRNTVRIPRTAGDPASHAVTPPPAVAPRDAPGADPGGNPGTARAAGSAGFADVPIPPPPGVVPAAGDPVVDDPRVRVPPKPTTPPPMPGGTLPAVTAVPGGPAPAPEDGRGNSGDRGPGGYGDPGAPGAPGDLSSPGRARHEDEEPEDETDVPTTSRSDSLRHDDPAGAESPPSPVGVQASAWSTASHPGRRRAARRRRLGLGPELSARDNDDRYAATGEVFVVADGLGGHPAGWYAADVAVRTLVADLAGADLSAGWSDRLRSAIALADLAVRRHGTDAYEGMRTTVVAAVLRHGRLHLAGCGDSVCWLVRGGRAFRLTEQGNAAEFGRPWLLTSTPLGGSQAPDPELLRIELHPGDRVVLATDGVGHLPDETIADLVHGDPFHAATTLTVTAVKSGDDDATAVVVECEALPVPEGHGPAPDPRENPEDASAVPGALRSEGGQTW